MQNAATAALPGQPAMTLTIQEIVASTPRTRIVRLDLAGRPFDYHPGQAVMVGEKGSAKRRPFSIAASPEDMTASGCLELLVRVDQPDGLPLVPGIELDVAGPMGSFTFSLEGPEKRLVFVAGGTGIAPVRAMMRKALFSLSGREIRLLYSARTPDEFPYQEELQTLAIDGHIQLWQTVTRQGSINGWRGHQGRIESTHLKAHIDDMATLFFVCGPVPFVHGVKQALLDLSVPASRIVIDLWC
jgi:propane monooxygenase reductase subunit